ncbi:universal stress protein [Kocuria sp. NPDC057446]|uniref:universal stress protein n=1 Tax=Kocuria sp. NPDC057446 TaxID=3346137 RepID=UPI0036A810F7
MDAPSQQPILVGIDGSDSSRDALRTADRIARALDVPLVALMFWQGPPVYEGWETVDPNRPPAGSEDQLRSTLADVFGAGVPAHVRAELLHGRPAVRLVEESERALMLVLGRRGHGGLRGSALGSVSNACIAHAHCPVLVVRH